MTQADFKYRGYGASICQILTFANAQLLDFRMQRSRRYAQVFGRTTTARELPAAPLDRLDNMKAFNVCQRARHGCW